MRCYAGGSPLLNFTVARGPCLYADATRPFWLLEAGLHEWTAREQAVRLVRLTSTGTQGQVITATSDEPDYVPITKAFNVHTADATVGTEYARWMEQGIGLSPTGQPGYNAGISWVFGSRGIKIPAGVTNGVGFISHAATTFAHWYFVWEE